MVFGSENYKYFLVEKNGKFAIQGRHRLHDSDDCPDDYNFFAKSTRWYDSAALAAFALVKMALKHGWKPEN